MVRIVVGGDELTRFEAGEFTDHYVKLQLPPPGAAYNAPFDTEEVRERYPREQWPRMRTYTVRDWDAERGASRSTSSSTATRASQAPGRPARSPATSCSSWARAAATRPTPTPPGTSWSATRRRPRHRRGAAAGPGRRARPRDRRGRGHGGRASARDARRPSPPWLHGDGTGDALAAAVRDLDFPRRRRPRVRPRRGPPSARSAGTWSSTAASRARRCRRRATGSARDRRGLARREGGVEGAGRAGRRGT